MTHFIEVVKVNGIQKQTLPMDINILETSLWCTEYQGKMKTIAVFKIKLK